MPSWLGYMGRGAFAAGQKPRVGFRVFEHYKLLLGVGQVCDGGNPLARLRGPG
jgi:hypothetical protein